jgi:hypothetical protein
MLALIKAGGNINEQKIVLIGDWPRKMIIGAYLPH